MYAFAPPPGGLLGEGPRADERGWGPTAEARKERKHPRPQAFGDVAPVVLLKGVRNTRFSERGMEGTGGRRDVAEAVARANVEGDVMKHAPTTKVAAGALFSSPLSR